MSLSRNAIAVPGRLSLLLVASCRASSRASDSRFPTRAPNASWKLIRAVMVGVGRCCAGGDVGLGGLHHLHHQAGVERMAGVDVLGEPVGVDERRVRRDVTLHVVGGGDHHEQLDIGAQPPRARVADGDGALHRRLGLGALVRMRPRDGEVDRRRRGQPLRGGHEGFCLVRVVGALGLAQQRGDAGQHLVVSLRDPLRFSLEVMPD